MALEHNAYLGRDDLGKLLRSFSLPCILSLLVSALYNIVDQIFIGNSELGYLGNAATGVVFPLLMVAMAFGWCVGDGCAAYLSLCQGKVDAQSAHRCVGSGVTMTFAASVFLMIVCGIWQEPLLRLFGASDTTIGMAMEYFTILLGAFPFYMLTNSTNGSIRADGSPKYAMLSTVSGAVTNIVLDPIFIFGLHWGIKGAAWATVAGQVLSFVLNAAYLLRKTKSFQLEKASFKPHWRVFFASVQLGISTFVTQISIVVVSLVTFTCFIKMTSIFFQAVGEPGKATAASLIRDLACFVPLALLLPHKFGIQGVLYAGPAADAIAMVVAVVLTVRFFQQMNRQAKKA